MFEKKFITFLSFFCPLLFLSNSLQATSFAPWFSNVFEFEGELTYGYDHIKRVQTPLGSFTDIRNNHHLDFSLGISPWPCWQLEAEVFLSHSPDIPFAFEAFLITGRYLLFDDISGDPLSVAIGATFAFPGERFTKDLGYVYHGQTNGEVHIGVGKEFANCCTGDWESRFWILAGYGAANRGSPWVHGLFSAEWQCSSWCEAGIFSELLFGLGHQDISPFLPFEGYAPIAHRSVDMGVFTTYSVGTLGYASVLGFYTVYAHNFPQHMFGFQFDILIPFSL